MNVFRRETYMFLYWMNIFENTLQLYRVTFLYLDLSQTIQLLPELLINADAFVFLLADEKLRF